MHHLFYVEVEASEEAKDSLIKGFIASGESDSEAKARELVEATLSDEFGGVCAENGSAVTHTTYLGVVDRDTFMEIGDLAQ